MDLIGFIITAIFFLLIIRESLAKEKKDDDIFYILCLCCYDVECKATFAPISFPGTTLQCAIFSLDYLFGVTICPLSWRKVKP